MPSRANSPVTTGGAVLDPKRRAIAAMQRVKGQCQLLRAGTLECRMTTREQPEDSGVQATDEDGLSPHP